MRLTGGAGVDIVLDMVGGDYLPRNLDCLAEDGRHVSIAVQRGATAEINLARVMTRRLTLSGSTLRPRSAAFKALVADELARAVWPHVEAGKLKPVIDSTFPLAARRRRPPADGSRATMSARSCWRWRMSERRSILHEYAASGNCYKSG